LGIKKTNSQEFELREALSGKEADIQKFKSVVTKLPVSALSAVLWWIIEKEVIVKDEEKADLIQTICDVYMQQIDDASHGFEIEEYWDDEKIQKNSQEWDAPWYKEDFKPKRPTWSIYTYRNRSFPIVRYLRSSEGGESAFFYGREKEATDDLLLLREGNELFVYVPKGKESDIYWVQRKLIEKGYAEVADELVSSFDKYRGYTPSSTPSFSPASVSIEDKQKAGKAIEAKVKEKLYDLYPSDRYEIKWNNQHWESSMSYDIEVIDRSSGERVKKIECKAQSIENALSLLLSRRQWEMFLADLRKDAPQVELWVGYYIKYESGKIDVRRLLRMPSHTLFHPGVLFHGLESLRKTSMMDEHGFGDDTEKIKVELSLTGLKNLYESTSKPDFDLFEFE
jgi:hypothetical protein